MHIIFRRHELLLLFTALPEDKINLNENILLKKCLDFLFLGTQLVY